MDKVKIRLKLRDNEFEAEGPDDLVRAHLSEFKGLMGNAISERTPPLANSAGTDASLGLIYQPDKTLKTLTLRILPSTDRGMLKQVANTLLLVLLGFHESLGIDEVPVLSAAQAIRRSGLVKVHRLSNAFLSLQTDGYALKIGLGKGTRYQLTSKGQNAAQTLIHNTLQRANLP